MIHSKPNVIIYIRRDSLVIAGKKIKPGRLTFPADIVQDLEVVDETKFIRGCSEFFASHELKGKRIQLVLDDSVVFMKPITDSDTAKPAMIKQRFVDAMPLAAGQRSCLIDTEGKSQAVYATNHQLFHAVVRSLEASGAGKVQAVTPARAYSVPGSQKLVDALNTYAADTATARRCDFKTVNPL